MTLATVNADFFSRVLFLRNFAYARFRENKTLSKWQNHAVDYYYTYIMPMSRISNLPNMSFNAIHEKKILAKISEFTVYNFSTTRHRGSILLLLILVMIAFFLLCGFSFTH